MGHVRPCGSGTANVNGLGIFPPGTPLLALPNWHAPRVVMSKSDGALRRWRNSSFYPATRLVAKLYRFAIRGRATLGWSEARQALGERWSLHEFLEDCLPATASIVLLTRPAGPAQKFTAELRDPAGRITGYVKYGKEALAQRRLTQDYMMLMRLPAGLGPTPLKFGNMGDGTALLVTPLCGQEIRARLPPASEVLEFAKSLEISSPLALDDHPYIRAVRQRIGTRLDAILEDLAGRAWPIVLHHGDLTPWNLRRRDDGLRAFDWEFGTPDGFPYIDLAHFILQVAFLIYSWPPVKSAIYATEWLKRQSTLGLTDREARALTRLAMFDAYLRAKEDGYRDDHPLRAWRRKIWGGVW
jgi:hypothetical protein